MNAGYNYIHILSIVIKMVPIPINNIWKYIILINNAKI